MSGTRSRKIICISILVILWGIVVFIAVKCGMAWDSMVLSEERTGILNFIPRYSEHFKLQFLIPFHLVWSTASKKAVAIGTLIWLVFCIYIYDIVSKNYYAHGKIHGTSVWGKRKDIKDLFAANIMKKEIFRVRLLRFALGRFFAMRRARTVSKNQSESLLNFELRQLEEQKTKSISANGLSVEERKDIIAEYEEKADDLKKAALTREDAYFAEEWKPYKYKLQYEAELADIERKYRQGLEISTDVEKTAAEESAKCKYDNAVKEFQRGYNLINELRLKYENADALYTKSERISIFNWILNNNALIVGGSSSGKTRSFVLPNILQAHSSYVITDPKGEILQKLGFFLEHIAGYKIRVLNLYKLSASDGYNPFAYIHSEREGYETRVLSLIEALIINTDGGEQQSRLDPFWPSAERLFLQSIFFFTYDGFPLEERNMKTVMELIRMLEIGETEDKKNSDLDYFVDIFAGIHGEDHVGVKNYREFRAFASGKTAMSIVASAVARLRTFDVPEVERIFSYDTMHLDRVGEEKTAIFVVVPPMEKTFNFVAGMMFTQLFQEIQYCATEKHKHDGMKVPIPIRFILDEFATTCTIPNFTEILAYSRSLGVGIVPIIQSLAQLKKIYEKDWGVIIDNCGAFLFLGSVTHDETLDYISEKLLGKGTWDKRTTGKSRGRNQSESQNYDEVGRVLKDSSELRRMPKKNCILIVNGRNPFYSEKYDYTQHPNYCFTSDANPSYAYDYIPLPPSKNHEDGIDAEQQTFGGLRSKATELASQVLSGINQSSDFYKTNSEGQYLLKRLGEAFPHLVPIRNELWEHDVDEDDEAILSSLGFEQEDNNIDSMLFESRKRVTDIVDDISKKVSVEKYNIATEPKSIANTVVEAGSNLVPIRNELFEDSSDVSAEKISDNFDVNVSIKNLDTLLEEISGILNNST